jgi:hypothetical protein
MYTIHGSEIKKTNTDGIICSKTLFRDFAGDRWKRKSLVFDVGFSIIKLQPEIRIAQTFQNPRLDRLFVEKASSQCKGPDFSKIPQNLKNIPTFTPHRKKWQK